MARVTWQLADREAHVDSDEIAGAIESTFADLSATVSGAAKRVASFMSRTPEPNEFDINEQDTFQKFDTDTHRVVYLKEHAAYWRAETMKFRAETARLADTVRRITS